jgi:pyruvate/2-oxoglutarate dehydrogenase complex dihydrolipoamide dehydrogenase (E3) component
MAKHEYDMGVIGGGSAGLTVAAGCGQLGVRTLLIEKEHRLGGDCLHYGCVPSKTLIHTAHVRRTMAMAQRFGLPGADLAPVDFSAVKGRIQEVIGTIQEHDSPERFCRLGVDTVFGEPRFLDEHTVEVDGRRITASKWTLATGSSPAAPPIEGLDETPCLTNKDIFYLDALPAGMIVLGGGPIAVEMSQAFARLGTRVTLIQRSRQILTGEDADMAGAVADSLAAEGVDVRTGCQVRRVGGDSRNVWAEYEDMNGADGRVEAETMLVALGRGPNVQDLGLEAAGVEYSRRGITVDSRMRTSQKHIYAAGDVVGDNLFTHAAGYEGSIIVSNAVFHLPRKADYALMPRCTYCWPELAVVGMNETVAGRQGIAYSVWRESFSGNDRALAEGEGQGQIKMLLDKRNKPLGVQILGPSAGELIAEWVAVMNGGVGLSKLAGAVHPYPTLGEISKRVAGSYVGSRLFSDKVRRILGFLFRYQGDACDPEK